MNNKRLPNINQLHGHMHSFIAYLVANNRADLLKILKDNGVVMKDPTDRQLITAIYIGIAKSKPFKSSIKKLMTDVSAEKLGLPSGSTTNFTGSINPENIDQFVKGGVDMEKGFKNTTGDSHDEDENVTIHETSPSGNTVAPHGWFETGESGSGMEQTSVKTGTSTAKKSFSETGFGSFLNNLFSKENVNKAVGTGIDVLGQKLSANANQQQLDAAIKLQAAKTEAEAAKYKTNEARSKWLAPVLIGGSILIIGVIVAVVALRKKK